MRTPIAHYYYGNGKQLVVSIITEYDEQMKRHETVGVTIRDENDQFPICPIRKVRGPYPSEEDAGCIIDPAYMELGLYYGYHMPGWE